MLPVILRFKKYYYLIKTKKNLFPFIWDDTHLKVRKKNENKI